MRLSSSSGGSRGEIWCNYSYRNDHGSPFPKAASEKICNVLLLFNFPCIFSSSLSPTNSRFELEVAGVTFSDSAPVPKFFNPGPDPEIFQIWESDSCSDSGYSRGNRKLPMVFTAEMTTRTFSYDHCHTFSYRNMNSVFLKLTNECSNAFWSLQANAFHHLEKLDKGFSPLLKRCRRCRNRLYRCWGERHIVTYRRWDSRRHFCLPGVL